MPTYTLDGSPTAIRHDGDGNSWITTQIGKVYKNGALLLDIYNKLPSLLPIYDERGLMGVALHPSIPNRYYLSYTMQGTTFANVTSGSSAPDTQWNEDRYTSILVLEEYEGQHPIRKLLEIKHPGPNHVGKDSLSFRPSDGKLVWMLGDDGFGYDLLNLSQRDEFVGGKIISIEIDKVPDSLEPISRTNQLPLGVQVEAKGLRNPISLQYTTVATRDITFITCPGQGRFEWAFAFEGVGQNFGWRTYEGPEKTQFPFGGAPHNDQDFPHFQPFLSYSHSQINNIGGTVITGGRLVGDKFYFMDWKNGLYQCQPDLSNLQKAVPFTKIEVPQTLSSYTSLGQQDNVLWIGGTLRGKGYVYSVAV